MFGLFKKTEEDQELKKKAEEQKLASLQQKAKSLNWLYSLFVGKLLLVPGGRYSDDTLVEFVGFYVDDNELRVGFRDSSTPPDRIKYWTWSHIEFAYGEDAIEHWHNRYIKLKNDFNLLGFEITKIEKP